MKKILGLLLGMIGGAVIGYGIAMLIIWVAEGELPSAIQSDGTDWGRMALAIGITLVAFIASIFVHLILHEAGHLVAGLLTGYRFISFRVFKYTLVKTDKGLRWKRFHIAGTGGQCILELPEDQKVEDVPWFWYNAGGVLMNIAIVILSILLLKLTDPGLVLYATLTMLAFVGVFMALMNGIPLVIGGISNDAHNLWLLWRHPNDRCFFVRSLQIAGGLSRGRRLTAMPSEWIEDSPVTAKSDYLQLSHRTLYMELLEDQGRYEEARRVAEELMALGDKLPQIFKLETGGERVMLELLTTGHREVVAELWTKTLARYTIANSKYSPIKCAVLYAYELLYNHDKEKADGYRQQLIDYQHDFTMPGEVLTAKSLIGAIDGCNE